MVIHFWGVRGSVPTPLSPQQLQSKIMAVVQRITAKDIENQETRAKFISSLPDWIYDTVGGNTACVQIKTEKTNIILDAGSGLRVLGKTKQHTDHYHLFFSHFHWDHIQGLPFFDGAYNPNAVFDVYSAVDNAKEILQKQMYQPYYPVSFDAFTKNFNFHTTKPGTEIRINEFKVNCCEMFHPGKSHSFSFETDGKKIVYATDVELRADELYDSPEHEAVFRDADCIILDAQYTVEEAYRKQNWGHSAFCYAIDFAVHWNVKRIFLFHHEPTYDDKKLNTILESARWYAQYTNHTDIEIYMAREGLEVIL